MRRAETAALMGVPPLGSFPLLRPPLRTAPGIRAKMFGVIAVDIAARRARVVHVALGTDVRPEKFSADGYHPSAESYAELGDQVAAVIVPMIAAVEDRFAVTGTATGPDSASSIA